MSDLSERMRNAIDVAEMGVTATPYISTEDIDDGMDAIKALYAYADEVAELEAALRVADDGRRELGSRIKELEAAFHLVPDCAAIGRGGER